MAKQGRRAAQPDRRYETLRALLIEARKAHGVTQVALAQRLGKEQAWVSKYESAGRRVDVVEYLDICRAIGADPYRLLRKLGSDSPAS